MFNTSWQEQHSEIYKEKTVSAMEASKNIQRKDSECDGVVQKYTKKRQWVWWSRPKIYKEKTVSVMESSKDIQRKDSECDGVVQRSWLIWCIKWMVCYHELTYTTEDSGVLTIVAFLWCCIIAHRYLWTGPYVAPLFLFFFFLYKHRLFFHINNILQLSMYHCMTYIQ
jgi:hypothetical protein